MKNGIAYPVDLAPEADAAGNENLISSASPAPDTPTTEPKLYLPYNLVHVLAELGLSELLPQEKDLMYPPNKKAQRAWHQYIFSSFVTSNA